MAFLETLLDFIFHVSAAAKLITQALQNEQKERRRGCEWKNQEEALSQIQVQHII